jgi:hypothetical protein
MKIYSFIAITGCLVLSIIEMERNDQKASQFSLFMKYNIYIKHFTHCVECLNPLITTRYQGNFVADYTIEDLLNMQDSPLVILAYQLITTVATVVNYEAVPPTRELPHSQATAEWLLNVSDVDEGHQKPPVKNIVAPS